MTFNATPTMMLVASFLVFLAALMLAWYRRGAVAQLQAQCRQVQTQLDKRDEALSAALAEKHRLEAHLESLQGELTEGASRIDQLRDLIKVHVARRRELDEWAVPIKAALGDAVGQSLSILKEQLVRQESALQRQERLMAESQAQYRAKRDEIERMRRELALKNYHIAALNERFIRIEERILTLGSQIADLSMPAGGVSDPISGSRRTPGHIDPQVTAPQIPLQTLDSASEHWSKTLDEWHQRLDRRFDQLDALRARLRGQDSPDQLATQPPRAHDPGDAHGQDREGPAT